MNRTSELLNDAIAAIEADCINTALTLLSAIRPNRLRPSARLRYRAVSWRLLQDYQVDGLVELPTSADWTVLRQADAAWSQAYRFYLSGMFEQALEWLKSARSLPSSATERLTQEILLLLGRWAEAWELNQFRYWRDPHLLWQGKPLNGCHVCLWLDVTETWGAGDAINFCWLATELKRVGADRVSIAASKSLADLLTCCPGVDDVGTTIPPDAIATTWYTAMEALSYSGPGAIAPPTAYLNPPQQWEPFPPGFKVGLCWAASSAPLERGLIRTRSQQPPRRRSIELAQLVPYLPTDIGYYSLQVGPCAADVTAYPWICDLSPQLRRWSDTAAAIAQLDLVLTVDTGVAHLAGAMGKPVWVLLGFVADWRWGVEGEQTIWYPSMRLLRCQSPDGWAELCDRAGRELSLEAIAHYSPKADG